MENEIEVAIFSYNRGKYLRNCVESVLQNMLDVKITVFDDNSDDKETVAYLSTLTDRGVTVVTTREPSVSRHGNLYKNMQTALHYATSRFMLFLQDDTQIVRAVDGADLKNIGAVFNDQDVAFLRPQLMKQFSYDKFKSSMTADAKKRAYIPISDFLEGTFGNSYCDLVLGDVPKLRKAGWSFSDGERANQIQAQSKFKHMPFMADGFVFYCPEVPCYRNKRMFWASKIAQSKLRGRISALKMLTETQSTEFKMRDINIWPIAENFLESTNPNAVKPFVYQDYSQSKLLLSLYKIESALYKIAYGILFLAKSSSSRR